MASQLDLLTQTAPGQVFKTLKTAFANLLPKKFAAIESRDLWALFADTNLLWLDQGDVLFLQGEAGNSAYVIAEGALRGEVVFKNSETTKTFEMQADAMLGEISLIAGVPRTATVTAIADSRLVEIPREAFATLLKLRPDLAEVLADLVAERQRSDNEYLRSLYEVDAEAIARSQERENILSYFVDLLANPHELPQRVASTTRAVTARLNELQPKIQPMTLKTRDLGLPSYLALDEERDLEELESPDNTVLLDEKVPLRLPARAMQNMVGDVLPGLEENNNSTQASTNLYLTDNFAPVPQEIHASDLTVVGELPTALNGTFFRIGPNPQYEAIGQYYWFDGDGMIHSLHLEHGQASYRNRWVETQGFTCEREEGKAIWPGLLEMPRFDQPHGLTMKNPANTSLLWFNDRLLALWEAGAPHQVDPATLETIGEYRFDGQLPGTFTAHPKLDPDTGELLFFGYSLMETPYLNYGIIDRAGQLTHHTAIDLPQPVMMHDFAITQHHTIFFDLPLVYNFTELLQGKNPMVFEPDQPSRFGVLPRYGQGDEVQWFEVSSGIMYHAVNAYETGENGETIVILGYCSPADVALSYMDSSSDDLIHHLRPVLTEWRLDRATGTATETILDTTHAEFPQINPHLVGRPCRYIYAALSAPYTRPKPLFDGVMKYDLETNTSTMHYFGRGCFGGECVFVPRPDASAEDDGWLLTYVHDTISDQSEFIVLDAQNLSAAPLARVLLPQRVPYGFHAAWVPV